MRPWELFFLSVCTFGIYKIWWSYRQWQAVKQADKSDINPVIRSFFAPLYYLYFFEDLKKRTEQHGLKTRLAPGALALAYFLFILSSFLLKPLTFVVFLAEFILLPVQMLINRLQPGPVASRLNRWDLLWLGVTGPVFILLLAYQLFIVSFPLKAPDWKVQKLDEAYLSLESPYPLERSKATERVLAAKDFEKNFIYVDQWRYINDFFILVHVLKGPEVLYKEPAVMAAAEMKQMSVVDSRSDTITCSGYPAFFVNGTESGRGAAYKLSVLCVIRGRWAIQVRVRYRADLPEAEAMVQRLLSSLDISIKDDLPPAPPGFKPNAKQRKAAAQADRMNRRWLPHVHP